MRRPASIVPLVLFLLLTAVVGNAQNGCEDSPEVPTHIEDYRSCNGR